MQDVSEKLTKTMTQLNEMCDVLMKAMPQRGSSWSQIPSSPNVPDYSPEQIAQARGSVDPIVDENVRPGPKAPPPSQELPSVPQETVRNLEQYTPDHLHQIIQHASRGLADTLFQAILKHQQGGQTASLPKQNPRENPMA